MCLKNRPYLIITGIIFALIAIMHLKRAVLGLPATLGGFSIPIWFSWVALIVSAYLSYSAFSLLKKVK